MMTSFLLMLPIGFSVPITLISRQSMPVASRACVRATESLVEDISDDGGCLMQRLRTALPNALGVADFVRPIVEVHFEASFSNGTMLYDSRASKQPLRIQLGAVPSDTVRIRCALRAYTLSELERAVLLSRFRVGN